jgi:hypothetical protein
MPPKMQLIQIVENGCIRINNQYTIAPGDDYSKQQASIQNVCRSIHTPEIVASYKALQKVPKLTLINGRMTNLETEEQ